MEPRQPGRTEWQVSTVCLGSMSFGEQDSEADAHSHVVAAIDEIHSRFTNPGQ